MSMLIAGYDINKWAVFFHLAKQARYVLQGNKVDGKESFITPIAFEIDRIITGHMNGEIDIGVNISLAGRKMITNHMRSHVDMVFKNRSINPTLLLLASIKGLLGDSDEESFPPMLGIFGSDLVKDFIENFNSKALESEHATMYKETLKVVTKLLYPGELPYRTNRIVNKAKSELKDVLHEYYGSNVAHGIVHVETVMKRALLLNEKYNLKIDETEIVMSALLHDIFSSKDRDNHHELAAKWVESSMMPSLGDKHSKARIANAIREHRASYKGKYSSPLSELLASADRDLPVLEDILLRMYHHRLDLDPKATKNEIIPDMIKHLGEKYSRDGYITYPDLYKLDNEVKLETLYNTIDKILSGHIRVSVNRVKQNFRINLKRKYK